LNFDVFSVATAAAAADDADPNGFAFKGETASSATTAASAAPRRHKVKSRLIKF
jgi:hypothetical protein